MTTKVIIITPWHGNGEALVADYVNATRHSATVVVAVNNGVSEGTANALYAADITVIGNSNENRGFAGGNEYGYAVVTEYAADDDTVICFLNSDVRGGNGWIDAMINDVQHGALYGRSLHQQLVLGRWLPYIEGWCIAATKATWERLGGRHAWAADKFPLPYWEDNDLCLRAIEHGVSLVQTQWHIEHIGGQTAGALVRWGEAFEANRATFVATARRIFAEVTSLSPLRYDYLARANTPSDINFHLPYLFGIAKGTVVELGTRGGNSTAAFLAGVEARGGSVLSIDIDDCSALFSTPLWRFVQASSIDPSVLSAVDGEIDVLFIDTDHTYQQCTTELELWYPRVRNGGLIIGHDPETFPGVRAAFDDFAQRHGERVTYVLPNNGLAIIEKRGEQ